MTSKVEEIFEGSGAILKGHFRLTSGLHSPIYWEKFRVLEQPNYTEQLCALIAGHFAGQKVGLVAGPTTGGIILAHEVARQMDVPALFAERKGDGRAFRQGAAITPGERVLVTDDVLTTGKSIREVIAAVSGEGGKVIGIGVLVDRSQDKIDFGVPLFCCLRSQTVTYTPEDCPLCAAGVPLTRPGSG